jgi:hypothetical protein
MLKKYIPSIVKIFLLVALCSSSLLFAQDNVKSETLKKYPYRKYVHVTNFYKNLSKKSVELGLKYNVPPAALLAIAGVESGYGRGYVARITGNILSLGAGRGEAQLPALYLPNLKKDKSQVFYSNSKISSFKKEELSWKKRPKSLKKDYRPKEFAGSTKRLDYFDKNPEKKIQANISNMEDFAKKWISINKKYKPFVEARMMLDAQVKLHSKEILFDKELNKKFIKMISGKPNSFNYRTTWALKVTKIMNKAGLVELTKSLHVENKSFNQLWL